MDYYENIAIYEDQLIKAAERSGFKLPEIKHLTVLSDASGKTVVSLQDTGEDIIIILKDSSGFLYSFYCQSMTHDDGYSTWVEHEWYNPPTEMITVFDLHDYFNMVEIEGYEELYKTYMDIEQEYKNNVTQRRVEKLEQDILEVEGEINKLNLKKKELSQYLNIISKEL